MSVSDRLNPEFTKIAEHYHAQKQHRKSIENDKKGLFSHVKHLEQLNTSLRSQLNRKSTELKYLTAVRQRYLQDLKQVYYANLESRKLTNITIKIVGIEAKLSEI